MTLRNPEVLQCVPESMRNDRHFVMSLLPLGFRKRDGSVCICTRHAFRVFSTCSPLLFATAASTATMPTAPINTNYSCFNLAAFGTTITVFVAIFIVLRLTHSAFVLLIFGPCCAAI